MRDERVLIAQAAMRRFLIVAVLGVAAAAILAARARAAITSSSITSPSDLSFFAADADAGSSDVTISGTTSGGNPLSDTIDVRCYYGSGVSVLVRSGRSLAPDGSFSFPAPLEAWRPTSARCVRSRQARPRPI